MDWLTPDELDRERIRWHSREHWRPQKGGWDQRRWIVIQDLWRRAL